MNIIFDLDGTLLDSLPDIHKTANTVLSQIAEPPLTRDQARSFIGNGVAVFVQKMRASRGISDTHQEHLVAAFMALYQDAHDLTQPYPNVRDTLDRLRAAGHTLAICTNKPMAPTRTVLAHLGLTGFTPVMAGDSLPQRKPDPAPLLATIAAMPASPSVFVGDSEVDAETAKRAGVPFFLFTEGYRHTPQEALPHHAVFSDFAALPEIVARQ